VQKGQLLFKVRSNDIAGAYSDYRKAVKNEQLAVKNAQLAKIQLDRAKLLFDDGAIPKSGFEIAQNNESAAQTALDNARVDLETATEHLKLLGSDPDHPSGIVEVYAPVSGIITDQQITNQSGVQALTAPNPFTISDTSHVWIICDVYENNMAQVHVGEYADVHLVAYPNRVLRGRISNILPTIDPNIRTAKVRLEVENPAFCDSGCLSQRHFTPMLWRNARSCRLRPSFICMTASVYMPVGNGAFRRAEVVAGSMLPNNVQEIISGIKPGDQVIANALVFQNTMEQ